MVETITNFILNFITALGPFGVFLAEFLDGLFVFVPSTLIFLVAGFVFVKGPMSLLLVKTMLWKVVLPSTVGLVLGSYIFYIPSYIYGKKFLDRWGKWIGVSWEDIEKLNEKFANSKWDEISIILARIALIPSVMVTVFCGLLKIPPKKYTIITLIGGFFKALSVALVGWYAGRLYLEYAHFIDRTEKFILIAIILLVAGFILYRKKLQKKQCDTNPRMHANDTNNKDK